MKILILGGTGAMGKSLVDILSDENDNEIFVTSRKSRTSNKKNVIYLKGDAHDKVFLKEILKLQFDVIVDFMSYSTNELKERLELLLSKTNHYIFLSSARVYAESPILTEKSDRLLDICLNKKYLDTDEYALTKARQEDLLKKSGKNNWTIVRPYITYNDNRLQLGTYEKEVWLSRILRGKTCVLPKELLDKKTTLTYGGIVSYAISKLILNDKAYGEIVHIAEGNSKTTWMDILNLYTKTLKKTKKIDSKFKFIENRRMLSVLTSSCYYQYYYDRCYNRVFDSSKLENIIGEKIQYQNFLEKCLINFLKNSNTKFLLDGKVEGIMDRISNEKTALNEFQNLKEKIKYFLVRYTPYFYTITRSYNFYYFPKK